MNRQRTRIARTIGSVLLTVLVAAGIVAVTASPSAASVGCTGWNCVGHDPYLNRCSLGSTKTTYTYYQGVPVAKVTNKYSWNCVSNWAEGSLTTAGRNMGLGINLFVYDDGSWPLMCYYNGSSNLGLTTENCDAPYYQTVNAWTDMVDGDFRTCARADVVTPVYVRGPEICQ